MKKRKLQGRVVRMIIVLTLLLILVMSSLLTWQYKQTSRQLYQTSTSTLAAALTEQLNHRGIIMVSYMADALTNALYTYNLEQVGYLLSTMKGQEGVVKSYVFDMDDKIIHDGTELITSYGERIPTNIATGLAQDPQSAYIATTEQDVSFSHYVHIGDEKIGGLVITLSLAQFNHDIQRLNEKILAIEKAHNDNILFSILLIGLLLIIITSLLSWKIADKFTRPIVKLSGYASKIGDGDYDFEMKVPDSEDEIANLSQSFLAMREKLKESSSQIKKLAYHDTLTDLPNRRLFKEKLEQAIKTHSNSQTSFSLLFIDIDNFKQVNDSLGHDIGDSLLIKVARRLEKSIRTQESCPAKIAASAENRDDAIISRLGGDEFTVILTSISSREVIAQIAQRIIKNLSQPYIIGQHKVKVGASIGISLYPRDGSCTSSIMKNADAAMYEAKFNGKNQYYFYNNCMLA